MQSTGHLLYGDRALYGKMSHIISCRLESQSMETGYG